MAMLKVRFGLNKGREGAPMEKLAEISLEAERFLRFLARDLGITIKRGEWLARDFTNGSVEFDATFSGKSSTHDARRFTKGLGFVAHYTNGRAADRFDDVRDDVRDSTLLQYAKIGMYLDPGEMLGLGLYENGDNQPAKWEYLTRDRSNLIREEVETEISSFGAIQGFIHAWYKESTPPHIVVRDLTSERLVGCIYTEALYQKVYDALKDRHAIVIISGSIKYDRATRSIAELKIADIGHRAPLSDEEFNSFFGSAPDFTGEMSTEDFLDEARERGF